MEKEGSFATRALSIIGFGLLAFAITILAGGVWSALLVRYYFYVSCATPLWPRRDPFAIPV